MADIFCNEDFNALLTGKRIVFVGDSNMRAIYKDWVWLKQNNTIMPDHCLKSKLEKSFAGDSLLARSELHNGRDFREVREYQDGSIYMHFMFVTKCFSDNVQNMLADYKSGKKPQPDIFIFNSCLWDISRWGPNGVAMYQKNMVSLLGTMLESLSPKTLVLFTTTLPISLGMRGGFLVPDVDFLKTIVPFDIVEANNFIRDLAVVHEFDVVDLHFHVRFEIHRRKSDGVHWEPIVVRHLTNVLLTHISMSFGVELPGRARRFALARIQAVETGKPTFRFAGYGLPASAATDKQEDFHEICSRQEITCPSGDTKLAPKLTHNSCTDAMDTSCDSQGSVNNAPFMENLYEAHPESNATSSFGTSRHGFERGAPVMANLYETLAPSYGQSRGGRTSHGVEPGAPVMANLYEPPASSYGRGRGGVSIRGFGQARAQTSGGNRRAFKKKWANDQQKNRNKPSIFSRLGDVCHDQNPNMNFYVQNQAQDYCPWMQPQFGAAFQQQQQRGGHMHVGGMHVSNYVESPLYPANEENAQSLFNSYPRGHGRGNPYNYNSRGFRRN